MEEYYLCKLRKFLDKEEYKSLKDWLREMSKSFLAKAHAPTCENPHLCPSSHPECEPMFGIHTAILWQIGQLILKTINSGSLRFSSIDNIRELINFARSVYYLHPEYFEYFLFVLSWEDQIDEKYNELLNKYKEKFDSNKKGGEK